MNYITSLLLSVVAGVISNYISKRLNRKDDDD